MTSKLSQMQAKFQQRQMQEKEEKLLKLYENQQQRAIDRVSRGSAGSNGSLSNANITAGKVRQMFDERRQKAGIDRSYPLEPLSKTMPVKTHRGASLDRTQRALNTTRKTNTTRTTRTFNGNATMTTTTRKALHAGSLYNNTHDTDETDEAEAYLQEHEDLVRIMNNHNISDAVTTLEDEEMPRIGFEDLGYDEDIFMGKLANVGGKLPSETIIQNNNDTHNLKKVSTNGSPNTLGKSFNRAKPPTRKPPAARAPAPAAVPVHKQQAVTPPRTTPSPSRTTTPSKANSNNTTNINNTRRESSSSGNSSKASTPAGSPVKIMSAPRTSGKSGGQGGDQNRPSLDARHSGRMSNRPQSVQRDDLTACRFCQRRFASDRIQKHEDICSRTAKKKRKTYDSTKHRLAGTEVEPYVRKSGKVSTTKNAPSEKAAGKQSTNKTKPTTSKTGWRQKHEEFIAAIRAAKDAQAFIAKGGDVRDLPPPPPSSNPDYVQCPHCGRRFNESAASRHIPKCANYDFNKPKGRK